jgi:hypothetical protein
MGFGSELDAIARSKGFELGLGLLKKAINAKRCGMLKRKMK